MIDMLVMRCPILDGIDVSYTKDSAPVFTDRTDLLKIDELELPLQASIDVDGDIVDLVHKWEKIPSSFGSLAFKVFDFRDAKDPQFFVEIKASPAKLMQGHNLYGSDDIRDCAWSLLDVLYMAYPLLSQYLNHKYWTVHQIDITYHSWAKTEKEADLFINSLGQVTQGQTKARGSYAGTVYFGKKNSRIKSVKVYNKYKETLEVIKKLDKSGDKTRAIYTPELVQWSKGMIRWESSIKARWLERRGYSNSLIELIKNFKPQAFWEESTKDIFKALEGKEMRIIKDDDILKKLRAKFSKVTVKGNTSYTKANSAYRTYRAIKADGYDVVKISETISIRTFYRHLEMLREIGLSTALIQNLGGEGVSCEVIPFVRYVTVDFREQFPPFAQAA